MFGPNESGSGQPTANLAHDVSSELAGEASAVFAAPGQRGLLIAMRPSMELFPRALRPAKKGAERFQRKGMGKIAHKFVVIRRKQIADGFLSDTAAGRIKCRHAVRGEKAFERLTVGRMLRRIHPIGNCSMRRCAAKRCRIVDDINNILMTK